MTKRAVWVSLEEGCKKFNVLLNSLLTMLDKRLFCNAVLMSVSGDEAIV